MSKQVKIDKDELDYLQYIAGAADVAFGTGSCNNCREQAIDDLRFVLAPEPVNG